MCGLLFLVFVEWLVASLFTLFVVYVVWMVVRLVIAAMVVLVLVVRVLDWSVVVFCWLHFGLLVIVYLFIACCSCVV